MLASLPADSASQRIVVVAGTSSNAGKTTLVCELLGLFPGWEAIKVTRGHYRSCGKQGDSCCVGHLLGEHAIVYSTPELTRVPGKDTDRFWRAGAANVHWVIAKSEQLIEGVSEALSRVRSPGVIIETTSSLAFLKPAVAVLVAPSQETPVKASAKKALRDGTVDAIYFFPSLPASGAETVPAHFAGFPAFDSSSKAHLFEMVVRRATG
jgi:molybdopterin-guanine dinucleotide biosynthesis protein